MKRLPIITLFILHFVINSFAIELIDNGFDEPYYSVPLQSDQFSLKVRFLNIDSHKLICFNHLAGIANTNERAVSQLPKHINIPEEVIIDGESCVIAAIERNSFNNDGYMSFSLPASLEFINENNFNDLALLQELMFNEGLRDIYENCFSGLSQLSTLNLPNSLYLIRRNCFNNCSFSSINWGYSLRYIYSYSFCDNPNLTSVSLPPNLKEIRTGCFNNCPSVIEVDIPTLVGDLCTLINCFNGCPRISKITCHALTPKDCVNCFSDVDKSQCILRVPMGSKSKYQESSFWSQFENIEEFPELPY